MDDARSVGLCFTCRWAQTVTNRRGSTFFRCLRADTDPRFVRYPRLPMRQCEGFEEGRLPIAHEEEPAGEPPASPGRGPSGGRTP